MYSIPWEHMGWFADSIKPLFGTALDPSDARPESSIKTEVINPNMLFEHTFGLFKLVKCWTKIPEEQKSLWIHCDSDVEHS